MLGKEGEEVEVKVEQPDFGDMLRRKLLEDEEEEEEDSTPAPTPTHTLPNRKAKTPSKKSIVEQSIDTKEECVDLNINVLSDAIDNAKDAAKKALVTKDKQINELKEVVGGLGEEIAKLKVDKETITEKYRKYKRMAEAARNGGGSSSRIKDLEGTINDVKSKAEMRETLLNEERKKTARLESENKNLETKIKEFIMKFTQKVNLGDKQGAIDDLETNLKAVQSSAKEVKLSVKLPSAVDVTTTKLDSNTRLVASKENEVQVKVSKEEKMKDKTEVKHTSSKTDDIEKLLVSNDDGKRPKQIPKHLTITNGHKTLNESSVSNVNEQHPKEVSNLEKSYTKSLLETKKYSGISVDSVKPVLQPNPVTQTPAKRNQRMPPGISLNPSKEELPKVPQVPVRKPPASLDNKNISIQKIPSTPLRPLPKTFSLSMKKPSRHMAPDAPKTRAVSGRQMSDIPKSVSISVSKPVEEEQTNPEPAEQEEVKESGESDSTVHYDDLLRKIQNQLKEIEQKKQPN